MTNRQSLNISVPGLLETELKVLQVAVVMLQDDDVHCGLLADGDSNGEIVFIDLDTDVGKSVFPQLRESQVKVIFSSDKKVAGKNTISLRKPIRVTTLKDILVQICKQIYEYLDKFHGGAQQAPMGAPDIQAKTQSDENAFQSLYRAKSEGLCMKLSCADCPDIFVNGIEKTIFCLGEQTEIAKYYFGEKKNISVQVLAEDELKKATQNLTPHALGAELWQAGVVCSNGKLLPGLRTDVPAKLKAWPNFSRQGFKPEYFKIAAIMAKQAMSIDELSKVTQVQLDIVIDFFNAAYAVDLVDTNLDGNKEQREQRQLSSERKTLLSKLAQRLKFA